MREHEGRTSRLGRELPLLDSITILEEFLAAHPDLPPGVRSKGTTSLANMHYKLARMYTEWGDTQAARAHWRKFRRRRPWDRRTLAALLRLPEK
jgi:hypothetical protein